MPGEGVRPDTWTGDVVESLGNHRNAFDNNPFMYQVAELTAQVMFEGHATGINPGIAKNLFKAINCGLNEWERDPASLETGEVSFLVRTYLQIFTKGSESLNDDQLEKLSIAYYNTLADAI